MTDTLPAPQTPLQANADDLLKLLSKAERLEQLPRTGWIVCGVQNPESIAAHTCMVALTALWIAEHHDAEPVNIAKLMRMALLHDLGESMLTDLPWPVKRFVGQDILKDAETRAASHLLQDAPPSWHQDYLAATTLDSIEARILKAADRIQMLAKSLQYKQQHRGDISRFWLNAEHLNDYNIPIVAAIFERLKAHYDHDHWFPCDFD